MVQLDSPAKGNTLFSGANIHVPQSHLKIELFMTMFFFPVVVNIFIFWITDNFLMRESGRRLKSSVESCDDSDQELLQEDNDNQTNPMA